MSFKDNYNMWLESEAVDSDIKNELKVIAENDKEIEDRFYKLVVRHRRSARSYGCGNKQNECLYREKGYAGCCK